MNIASPGLSWAALGRSWAALGRSLVALGRSWVALGRSWATLGRSWAALEPLLGRSGALLAAGCACACVFTHFLLLTLF